MAVLYLIRHGQASFGDAEYDRLSGIGERQARILGHHLQRGAHSVDALCSGGLQRQDRTAEIAREAMGDDAPPLHTEQAFSEYDHVALFHAYLPAFMETLGDDAPEDFQALLAQPKLLEQGLRYVLRAWIENQDHGGGPLETFQQFCARIAGGVDRLVRRHGPKGRIAVVTSGGPITYISSQPALAMPPTAATVASSATSGSCMQEGKNPPASGAPWVWPSLTRPRNLP